MCGIAGIINFDHAAPVARGALEAMAASLRHRGPDASGVHLENGAGLAHARLSVIDLEGGAQPMSNGEGLWITFNGEIFNYLELREGLSKRGHRFRTASDTEVLLHLYEELGEGCLDELNGQFAFAIWDAKARKLFAARDRLGIRPLFYSSFKGAFYFASESKALFSAGVEREIEKRAIDQIFTFWHTVPPVTAFKGVFELPPAHFLTVKGGDVKVNRYWSLPVGEAEEKDFNEEAERLKDILLGAVKLQMRSDVPVGAYLSGGLDSSITAALMMEAGARKLHTFSVAFDDGNFDESRYQEEMARSLGVEHHRVLCASGDIAENLPEAVWHGEKPILRTAPVPLFILSKLVRDSGIKVVMTGEGADEVFGGYDIFRETKIREFCGRAPASRIRPVLFKAIYPYLPAFQNQPGAYREAFFKAGGDATDAFFSHRPRWETVARNKLFFSEGLKEALKGASAEDDLSRTLPEGFKSWATVKRAEYLEASGLLPGYILSSQGDRVAMAHSVEGRFPFLDHNLVEFSASLPHRFKIRGLKEKHILKKAFASVVPDIIRKRVKQPYLAPESKCFFKDGRPLEYVEHLLSDRIIDEYGYFDKKAVRLLVNKCARNANAGFRDNMAFVGILTAQLLHREFIEEFGALSGATVRKIQGEAR